MKKFLNSKPKCLKNMGSDVFVTMPLYKEKEDYPVIYINRELYKDIFKKEYDFDEASKDIKNAFGVTIIPNDTDPIGEAYIDKQGDPTGIALSENKGSGRAYYIGSNYNIKGEKTVLCTSSIEEYNNGKYPLEAAFEEAMISEVLHNTFNDTFRVLAIIDKKNAFKFPKSVGPLDCGLIIRYYDNNELYRFSHRFINNKKFDYDEITSICTKMGKIEGNKVIHRFLHGAWSLGNISVDCNLIDFDTSFFVKGRQPSWIYSVAHKENYFGHEEDGQKRVIDILYDNKMLSCDISRDELYKIIDDERSKTITNGFLELLGYDPDIYPQYKDKIDDLVSLFIKLYPKMVYNYDKMNCSNPISKKNNLFDFSNLFRFYNIHKNYNKEDLFSLLINPELEILQYDDIYMEHYDLIYNAMKSDLIVDPNEFNDAIKDAYIFIDKFKELNDLIDSNLKIPIDLKIRKTYLKNETKHYLLATTWLRGALCAINQKYGPKNVNTIINFVTNYYSQKDYNNFNSDLIIFEEGLLYRNISNNGYKYVFEIFNDIKDDNISLTINKEKYVLNRVENNIFASDNINNLNLDIIDSIKLYVNNKEEELNIVDFID